MIRKSLLLVSLIFSLLLSSCGGGSKGRSVRFDGDPGAYEQGIEWADRVYNFCGRDTMALQGELLEFHAAASALQKESGEKAYESFRQGFQERLTELDPELADRIF